MAHDQTLEGDRRTIALAPLTKIGIHIWKLVAVWQASRTCKLVTATRMLLLERRLRCLKKAVR